MEVPLVGGDNLPGRDEIRIDENVHVPGTGNYLARRINRHPYCTHFHNESGRYDGVVRRLSEEGLGRDRLLLALFVLRWRFRRRLIGGRLPITLLFSLGFRFSVGCGQGRQPFRVADRLQIGAKSIHRRVDDINENEKAQDGAADSDQGVNSVH